MVLGHTRLSIVDVRKGRQPILADGGLRGIVCNGEIYNYKEIKKRLEPKYAFATDSDTEVVLHLYREIGPACVKDLDGMFAFAAFDGDDFMLARDPIGIKPLYYGYIDGKMYFASELGAMSLAGVWRYKVQYTQGAGCEDLGEKLAEQEMSDDEYERIRAENPLAVINSKEAAYYFKIFRQYHPQDSVLGSIGIWTGFDFAEEREKVRGTMDGSLKHTLAGK